MLKQMTKKSLFDAPEDQCFWVNHGPILQNIRDLERALQGGEINDEQFRYHVGRGKNDFAAWMKDVLHDEQGAKALSRVKTRKTALRVVSEHLKKFR
jgi:hypothetical protein